MPTAVKSTMNQSGNRLKYGLSAAALATFWVASTIAQAGPEAPVPEQQVVDQPAPKVVEPDQAAGPQEAPAGNATTIARVGGDRIVVTARRVEEDLQEAPIPVSVLNEGFLADSGALNVGKINQLVPSVQFYSTNPRNSAINIRGLGSPFGLTNDGIEQGVGLYVDGFAGPGSPSGMGLNFRKSGVPSSRGPPLDQFRRHRAGARAPAEA